MKTVDIRRFLDDEGRVTQLPSRQAARLAVLAYLAGKFQPDTVYTEKQVNALCDQWHTFGDYFLLRRELVDSGMLDRARDGSRYELCPQAIATQAPCNPDTPD